jgi:hypothetical protein
VTVEYNMARGKAKSPAKAAKRARKRAAWMKAKKAKKEVKEEKSAKENTAMEQARKKVKAEQADKDKRARTQVEAMMAANEALEDEVLEEEEEVMEAPILCKPLFTIDEDTDNLNEDIDGDKEKRREEEDASILEVSVSLKPPVPLITIDDCDEDIVNEFSHGRPRPWLANLQAQEKMNEYIDGDKEKRREEEDASILEVSVPPKSPVPLITIDDGDEVIVNEFSDGRPRPWLANLQAQEKMNKNIDGDKEKRREEEDASILEVPVPPKPPVSFITINDGDEDIVNELSHGRPRQWFANLQAQKKVKKAKARWTRAKANKQAKAMARNFPQSSNGPGRARRNFQMNNTARFGTMWLPGQFPRVPIPPWDEGYGRPNFPSMDFGPPQHYWTRQRPVPWWVPPPQFQAIYSSWAPPPQFNWAPPHFNRAPPQFSWSPPQFNGEWQNAQNWPNPRRGGFRGRITYDEWP